MLATIFLLKTIGVDACDLSHESHSLCLASKIFFCPSVVLFRVHCFLSVSMKVCAFRLYTKAVESGSKQIRLLEPNMDLWSQIRLDCGSEV